MQAPEFIRRLPVWGERELSHCTALPRATGNPAYHVVVDGLNYVVKSSKGRRPGTVIDHKRLQKVSDIVSDAGLGPALIFSDDDTTVLQYIPGEVLSADGLRAPANLDRVAGLLRRVHELPLCGDGYDLLDVANDYARRIPYAHAEQGQIDGKVIRLHELVGEAGRVPAVLTHCDAIASNIVDDGRLRLIDWEYGGDGDRHFDLAVCIVHHHFSARERSRFLDRYQSGARAGLSERVRIMERVYEIIAWLWARAQPGPVSNEL